VRQADSSSAFDDLDAALQSGSSEKRVAMLRQVLLVPCKTAEYAREAVNASLALKLAPKAEDEKTKTEFAKLSKPNARRLLRYWQVREISARSA
jgi:hypothetical protein